MGVECWLMCVVRRMFGAQICSVVRWLFGCGLVGLLVVLIVPILGNLATATQHLLTAGLPRQARA